MKQLVVLLLVGQIFLVGAVLEQKLPISTSGEIPRPEEVVMKAPKTSTTATEGSSQLDPTKTGKPVTKSSTSAPFHKPLPITILGITPRGDKPFSTIDFDLAAPISLQIVNLEGRLLRFRVAPPLLTPATATRNEISAFFEKLTWLTSDRYTEFVFHGKSNMGRPVLATSSVGLPRLSISFQAEDSALPLKNGEVIATGLTYFTDRASSKNGHSDVFALKARSDAPLTVFPTLANEGISQRENLSSMARRYTAIAGINAAYFTPKGEPIGTMIIDRRLVSSPYHNRSVFGINSKQQAVFGYPVFSGVLRWLDKEIGIDAINTPRLGDDVLVIYTPEFARSTLTKGNAGIELVLVKSRVIGIRDADSLIPPDGVVVSATGNKADKLRKIRLGDLVDLNYQVNTPWNQILHAVCGGPRLITDGLIDVGQDERFDSSIINGRHPRTAVALTYEGDLLFVVVDGRSRRSAGMTLSELALYLKKCGARYAMNLDGGGSSAMWVKNRIVNHPSDGKERPISNGLLIGTKN